MSLFDKLKEAFESDPESFVDGFGFHINGRSPGILRSDHTCSPDPKGDFCTWFEDGGNYECKKCGERSTDITDSYRIIKGIEGEHAATKAAEALAVERGIPFQRRRGRKKSIDLPEKMSPEILEIAQRRLMGPSGADARAFIAKQWKVDAEDLIELGIGLLYSKKDKMDVLVLSTYDEKTGELGPRYKKQLPISRTVAEKARGAGKRDRIWAGGDKTVQPPRLWPRVVPGDMVEEFVIVEGESDLITARVRLEWQDTGVYPVAVYGKNTIPRDDAFPECMAGKKVTILVDIDAFQGPLGEIVGDDKQKSDCASTTRGHLRNLAQFFRSRNCEVRLATVAGDRLDPVANPKGDLKDWANAGGREFSELRSWSYDEIYGELEKVRELTSVVDALNAPEDQRVSIVGRVHSIEEETITSPQETVISCRVFEEDMAKMCSRCGVPERIGVERTQHIPWDRMAHERADALFAHNQEQSIIRNACQKPGPCTALSVRHPKKGFARRWRLVDVESAAQSETISVVSEGEAPPIVGRVKVTGRVFAVNGAPRLVAETVEEMDANTVDIDAVRDELLNVFPHNLNDPADLDKAVWGIAEDVGANITDISNREDLHIGTMLAMCSTLYYRNETGRLTRGWIDVAIMGLPREGKSKTVERMMQALEMGAYVQVSSGATAPGLTSSSADKKSIKPGVWPKNHGRMVCLDEMQTQFDDGRGRRGALVEALQSARSDGYIDSAKCTGDARMPASVRTVFIANFPRKQRQFYCEDMQALFPTHEAMARMDFPMIVDERVPHVPVEKEHVYKLPLIRTVVQRSWSQTADHVKILPDAFREASDACERWESEYETDIAMFTGSEKSESIMRVAIAVANLTFSFSSDDATLMTVEVRRCHVQWAVAWMEQCWNKAQYDRYSERQIRAHTVQKCRYVCSILTSTLPDAPSVEAVLQPLLDSMPLRDYVAHLPGNHYQEQMAFFHKLRQHRVIHATRGDVEPTRGGRQLISNLIELSIVDEDAYERAQKQWAMWSPDNTETGPELATNEDYDLLMQNGGQW